MCLLHIVIAFAVVAAAVGARKAQYTLPDCADCKYMHEQIKANGTCMPRVLGMVFFALAIIINLCF